MTLLDGFKDLMKKRNIDDGLLVPLLCWSSGDKNSIEKCQNVNKKFFKVNKKILSQELSLNNKLNHFIKYPKKFKEDKDLKFFYLDVAKYFGWTTSELNKNIKVINLDSMKEEIAQKFGYNNKERRLLKLKKIKGAQ